MGLTFQSLRLAGWKSIRDVTLGFRPINLLIGANGAGKSNLIEFFRLLREMIGGRLQLYVHTHGGPESLLHFGSKVTERIECELRFWTNDGADQYSAAWVPGRPTGLVFEGEWLAPPSPRDDDSSPWNRGGPTESLISRFPENVAESKRLFGQAVARCRPFHFDDTTRSAGIRQECPVIDNRFLAPDGGNLAAMLYLFRERFPTVYARIRAAVRAVAPYFDDFALEPLRLNPNNIMLEWRTRGSEYVQGPHQLSDGTLRFIALATVLNLPDEDRPELLILDEPELGLHPAALAVLADLLKAASARSTLLVATQSALLIDHFEPADVVTVDLRDGRSTFERLDAARLAHWLRDYTLSELWEQNVIGGGPY